MASPGGIPVWRVRAGHTHAGRGFDVATQPGDCALHANVPPQWSHVRRPTYRPAGSPIVGAYAGLRGSTG
jgi:hypothetical protein